METYSVPWELKKSDIARSDFLDLGPPEETLGSGEEDDEEHHEGDGVLVGVVLGGHERLRGPDDETADHRPGHVAEAAEHDHGQALQADGHPELVVEAARQSDERPCDPAEDPG